MCIGEYNIQRYDNIMLFLYSIIPSDILVNMANATGSES